jgi:DNA-binding ferritin-like protein (Dps family)
MVIQKTKVWSNLFKHINQYQLCFASKGVFDDKIIDQILSLSETSLETLSESTKNKKKVYFILFESLQNITRHQKNPLKEDLIDGFFAIYKAKDQYMVTSGNLIRSEDESLLRNKIDMLNALNAEELKIYYQEALSSAKISEKGGAGLGFIEIMRKSGNKLSYDFEKINNEYSYFYFQTLVGESQDDTLHYLRQTENKFAYSLHKMLINHHVCDMFFGHFSHEYVKDLMGLAEANFEGLHDTKSKKTLISVMIEMLQNICIHGASPSGNINDVPGQFLITQNKNQIHIVTVNFVYSNKIDEMFDRVATLNNMNKKQLKETYISEINDETASSPYFLGFTDIRKKTGNPIAIDIVPHSDDLSILTLVATITI